MIGTGGKNRREVIKNKFFGKYQEKQCLSKDIHGSEGENITRASMVRVGKSGGRILESCRLHPVPWFLSLVRENIFVVNKGEYEQE